MSAPDNGLAPWPFLSVSHFIRAFSAAIPPTIRNTVEADSRGTLGERQIRVEDELWYRVNKTRQAV